MLLLFLKRKTASCLMTQAPSNVSPEQLNELNIKIKHDVEAPFEASQDSDGFE